MAMRKRLVKLLMGTRSLVWKFPFQSEEEGQVYSPRTGHVVVAWGGTFYVSCYVLIVFCAGSPLWQGCRREGDS